MAGVSREAGVHWGSQRARGDTSVPTLGHAERSLRPQQEGRQEVVFRSWADLRQAVEPEAQQTRFCLRSPASIPEWQGHQVQLTSPLGLFRAAASPVLLGWQGPELLIVLRTLRAWSSGENGKLTCFIP